MSQGRCVGLVGGLGVGAAIHYYRALAKALEQNGSALDLVMVNADMERVLAFMEAGDLAGFAEYLSGIFERMKAAGAEVAVIPSVTGHGCARELARIAPLPFLSIFDPLRDELRRRDVRRVALFGTRFVIQSRLFGFIEGVDFVLPQPAEVEQIHSTYVQIARDGYGTPEQHRTLTTLAHTLVVRERLDAIVLAGTDLSLLFNESNTKFAYLDCAALHVAAIARALHT